MIKKNMFLGSYGVPKIWVLVLRIHAETLKKFVIWICPMYD